jgi:hypothetical protein
MFSRQAYEETEHTSNVAVLLAQDGSSSIDKALS